MLDPTRAHDTLAGIDRDNAISEFDAEDALPHHEELVFALMLVPREFALDLDELDLLAIERGDCLWPPMLVKQREFFVEADLLHRRCPRTVRDCSTPGPLAVLVV